jgi:hypothetical protein
MEWCFFFLDRLRIPSNITRKPRHANTFQLWKRKIQHRPSKVGDPGELWAWIVELATRTDTLKFRHGKTVQF